VDSPRSLPRSRDEEEGDDLLRPVATVSVVVEELPVALPDLDAERERGDKENDERKPCERCRATPS
jgi:hypothetical protein